MEQATVREMQGLGKVVQHDRASKRRGERGNEQTVISPRYHAGDCSGGVAAEAVGDKPFLSQPVLGIFTIGTAEIYSANELFHYCGLSLAHDSNQEPRMLRFFGGQD